MFGDDNSKDESAVRDYIHVTDLAKSHVRAVEKLMFDDINREYQF